MASRLRARAHGLRHHRELAADDPAAFEHDLAGARYPELYETHSAPTSDSLRARCGFS